MEIDFAEVLKAITTLIMAGIAISFALSYKKFGEDNVSKVMQIAKIAVMAVEQLGKVYGWDSKRKKDEAMDYAIESLREKGIEVSKKDLDMAIEAVVSQLNKYV